MPHVLLVGDFVKHTGFARVNEALAAGLQALGWQVSVLAVRYTGDPTPLQQTFRLYPADTGNDYYGMRRLPNVIAHAKPDVVLLVNDPWIVDDYLTILNQVEDPLPPIAAYMPVDGPNLNPLRLQQLGRLDAAIAYTEFGGLELAKAGLEQEIAVIPHGIDLALFRPLDQWDARRQLGIPDGFVVLLSDANSSRKRQDLAIRAFAEFARDAPDAWLLIHSEMNSPWGWDLAWLCRKAGVLDQTIFTGKHGKLTDDKLRVIYSCADVYLSASMGEGWGFGAMEAMACGLPVIAPNWAALAEWANDAAVLIDCDPEQTFAYVAAANQEGGVVSVEELTDALQILAREPAVYRYWRERGRKRVADPRFRWTEIARQFDTALLDAVRSAAARQQALDADLQAVDQVQGVSA